ncbi:MAG TPA: hypothetical protein VGG56_08795 [Terracidiphilus sp.]
MKGMICAGMGIALGIVVGTLVASGSGRTANPAATVASVSQSISPPANSVVATSAHTVVVASANPPVPVSAKPPAALPAATIPSHSPVTATTNRAAASTAQAAPLQHHPASSGSPYLPVAQELTAAKTSATHKISTTHKRRSLHMLAARRRRWGRRARFRHRLHTSLRAPLIAKLTPDVPEPGLELDRAQKIIGFSIEGDATEANYSASAGLIQTYEGVTFALDKTASGAGAIALLDYPANIHYRCNQAGSCTLVRAGAVAVSAMRINPIALVR